MEGETRGSGDLWSGVVLALLGVYIIAQARQWEYSSPEGPGAGFFPLWYGVGILALSVLLVASHFRRAPRRGEPVDWRRIGRAFSVWLALAASVLLFNVLGFVAGLALLTYFVVAVMYGKPARTAAAVALATGLGFYLVFDRALGLALPAGMVSF